MRTLQEAKQKLCVYTWVIMYRRHGCDVPDNITVLLERSCLLESNEMRDLKSKMEARRQLIINSALKLCLVPEVNLTREIDGNSIVNVAQTNSLAADILMKNVKHCTQITSYTRTNNVSTDHVNNDTSYITNPDSQIQHSSFEPVTHMLESPIEQPTDPLPVEEASVDSGVVEISQSILTHIPNNNSEVTAAISSETNDNIVSCQVIDVDDDSETDDCREVSIIECDSETDDVTLLRQQNETTEQIMSETSECDGISVEVIECIQRDNLMDAVQSGSETDCDIFEINRSTDFELDVNNYDRNAESELKKANNESLPDPFSDYYKMVGDSTGNVLNSLWAVSESSLDSSHLGFENSSEIGISRDSTKISDSNYAINSMMRKLASNLSEEGMDHAGIDQLSEQNSNLSYQDNISDFSDNYQKELTCAIDQFEADRISQKYDGNNFSCINEEMLNIDECIEELTNTNFEGVDEARYNLSIAIVDSHEENKSIVEDLLEGSMRHSEEFTQPNSYPNVEDLVSKPLKNVQDVIGDSVSSIDELTLPRSLEKSDHAEPTNVDDESSDNDSQKSQSLLIGLNSPVLF